jgi:hypothetical protein
VITPLALNGKTFQVTRKVAGKDIAWTAECSEVFQLQDAADLQTMCGYDTRGYGFYSFRLTAIAAFPARYKATWQSSASSD